MRDDRSSGHGVIGMGAVGQYAPDHATAAATNGVNGSAQPASQSMSKQTALYYQRFTGGQLVAFRHADGNWYLCASGPVDADAAAVGGPCPLAEVGRW